MDSNLRKRVSLKNPVHFLALGFGSGLIPLMPGTFGSLAALPILFVSIGCPIWLYLVVTVLACLVGIYLCGKTADDMQVHDHGSIVWDEIAGMLLTFMFVPLSLTTVTVGFLLFRLFDILKPWPIRWADTRVDGGLGIMLDDILAGMMACAVLHLLNLSFSIF